MGEGCSLTICVVCGVGRTHLVRARLRGDELTGSHELMGSCHATALAAALKWRSFGAKEALNFSAGRNWSGCRSRWAATLWGESCWGMVRKKVPTLARSARGPVGASNPSGSALETSQNGGPVGRPARTQTDTKATRSFRQKFENERATSLAGGSSWKSPFEKVPRSRFGLVFDAVGFVLPGLECRGGFVRE